MARNAINLDTVSSTFEYLMQNRIASGMRMHIGVVGNHVSDDAEFEDFLWSAKMLALAPENRRAYSQNGDSFLKHCLGFVVTLSGQRVELPWGDIIEMWPLVTKQSSQE